jgi:putative transposase
MSNERDIRHGRHCIFKLHVHLVFVAKYRRRVFDAKAIDVLRDIFADVCSDAQATLVEMDGEDDHVHEYPPKVAVASLVNSLKGVSSRLLRQLRPDIRKRYWKGVLWSPSYSLPPAAELPSASYANTSSNRKLGLNIHDSFAARAILP